MYVCMYLPKKVSNFLFCFVVFTNFSLWVVLTWCLMFDQISGAYKKKACIISIDVAEAVFSGVTTLIMMSKNSPNVG